MVSCCWEMASAGAGGAHWVRSRFGTSPSVSPRPQPAQSEGAKAVERHGCLGLSWAKGELRLSLPVDRERQRGADHAAGEVSQGADRGRQGKLPLRRAALSSGSPCSGSGAEPGAAW